MRRLACIIALLGIGPLEPADYQTVPGLPVPAVQFLWNGQSQ